MNEKWSEVDQYFCEQMVPGDDALEATLRESTHAGLPQINVAPNQGKLLQLLAKSIGAKRILEIGTLGGYSTIWLGRALPEGGSLVTLEFDPMHAEVAMANIDYAGLSDLVQVRQGAAIDLLPGLADEGMIFDFTFIDADKKSIPAYFEWALKLSHPGSVIIVDNVVRNGEVANAASEDVDVQGVRQFLESLKTDSRVSATAIQTVGSKGYDGFAMVLVL